MRQQTLRDKLLGYPAPQIPEPQEREQSDRVINYKLDLCNRGLTVRFSPMKIAEMQWLSEEVKWDSIANRLYGYRFNVQCGSFDIQGSAVHALNFTKATPLGALKILYDLATYAVPLDMSFADYMQKRWFGQPQGPNHLVAYNRGRAFTGFWNDIGVIPYTATLELDRMIRANSPGVRPE